MGLIYYGYRYYSPRLGRWVSRDPIGERGGLNLYRFVENSPTDLIDPDGRIAAIHGYVKAAGIAWNLLTGAKDALELATAALKKADRDLKEPAGINIGYITDEVLVSGFYDDVTDVYRRKDINSMEFTFTASVYRKRSWFAPDQEVATQTITYTWNWWDSFPPEIKAAFVFPATCKGNGYMDWGPGARSISDIFGCTTTYEIRAQLNIVQEFNGPYGPKYLMGVWKDNGSTSMSITCK